MIVVIDHFDSFVEILACYVREAGHSTHIMRQTTSVDEVLKLKPDGLILSPGPGTPDNSGVSLDLIKARQIYATHLPILGVCLGHQVLAQAYGGTIARAIEPRHGKASPITHNNSRLFNNMPSPFLAGRYHALIAKNLPTDLLITATSPHNEIMGFEHAREPVFGVQFHPESVMTPQGHQLIENFLAIIEQAGT